VSQDPVDRLILQLVQAHRQATLGEVEQIIDRMVSVPFHPAIVSVKMRDRGLASQGQTLGARVSSLTYHLIQRVVVDPRWAPGTTAAQFVADLRAAAPVPQSRLGLSGAACPL